MPSGIRFVGWNGPRLAPIDQSDGPPSSDLQTHGPRHLRPSVRPVPHRAGPRASVVGMPTLPPGEVRAGRNPRLKIPGNGTAPGPVQGEDPRGGATPQSTAPSPADSHGSRGCQPVLCSRRWSRLNPPPAGTARVVSSTVPAGPPTAEASVHSGMAVMRALYGAASDVSGRIWANCSPGLSALPCTECAAFTTGRAFRLPIDDRFAGAPTRDANAGWRARPACRGPPMQAGCAPVFDPRWLRHNGIDPPCSSSLPGPSRSTCPNGSRARSRRFSSRRRCT